MAQDTRVIGERVPWPPHEDPNPNPNLKSNATRYLLGTVHGNEDWQLPEANQPGNLNGLPGVARWGRTGATEALGLGDVFGVPHITETIMEHLLPTGVTNLARSCQMVFRHIDGVVGHPDEMPLMTARDDFTCRAPISIAPLRICGRDFSDELDEEEEDDWWCERLRDPYRTVGSLIQTQLRPYPRTFCHHPGPICRECRQRARANVWRRVDAAFGKMRQQPGWTVWNSFDPPDPDYVRERCLQFCSACEEDLCARYPQGESACVCDPAVFLDLWLCPRCPELALERREAVSSQVTQAIWRASVTRHAGVRRKRINWKSSAQRDRRTSGDLICRMCGKKFRQRECPGLRQTSPIDDGGDGDGDGGNGDGQVHQWSINDPPPWRRLRQVTPPVDRLPGRAGRAGWCRWCEGIVVLRTSGEGSIGIPGLRRSRRIRDQRPQTNSQTPLNEQYLIPLPPIQDWAAWQAAYM